MKVNKNIVLTVAALLSSVPFSVQASSGEPAAGFSLTRVDTIGLPQIPNSLGASANTLDLPVDPQAMDVIATNSELFQARSDLARLKNECKALTELLHASEATVQERDEAGKVSVGLIAELTRTNKSLTGQLETLENKLAQAEDTILAKQSALDAQKAAMAKLTAENERIASLEGATSAATDAQEKAASRVAELEMSLHSQSAELATLQKQLEDAQIVTAAQTIAINDLELKLAQAVKDKADFESQSVVHASFNEKASAGNHLLAELEQVGHGMPQPLSAEQQAELTTLRKQVEDSQKTIEAQKAALDQLHNDLQTVREEHGACGATAQKIDALERQVAQLQAHLEGARNALEAADVSNADRFEFLEKVSIERQASLVRVHAEGKASQKAVFSAQMARQKEKYDDLLRETRTEMESVKKACELEVVGLRLQIESKKAEIAQLKAEVQTLQTGAAAQRTVQARLEGDLEVACKALHESEARMTAEIKTVRQQQSVEAQRASAAALQQEKVVSGRTIAALQQEVRKGQALRADMLGAFEEQRTALQKQIDTLTEKIRSLELQLTIEKEKVSIRDRGSAAFRVREQEVAQLKVLRDQIVATVRHDNFEIQAARLQDFLRARMTLLRSQIDEKRAELEKHVASSGSSVTARLFGAMAQASASVLGTEGVGLTATTAAAGATLESRAQNAHRLRKEFLESEAEALSAEREAHQLCSEIVKIAVDMRQQVAGVAAAQGARA